MVKKCQKGLKLHRRPILSREHSAYRCRNLPRQTEWGHVWGQYVYSFTIWVKETYSCTDLSEVRNANISKMPSSKVCAGSTPPPALIQSESYIKHHIQCRLILWQGSSCDSQPIKSRIVEGLFLKPTAGGSNVAFADEAPTVASGSPRPGALNYGISSLHSKARICSHEFVMKTWRKNKAGLWQWEPKVSQAHWWVEKKKKHEHQETLFTPAAPPWSCPWARY